MKFSEFDIKEVKAEEKKFPKDLKKIKNAPRKLYYRGNIDLPVKRIGIVGSRRMSRYGREVVEKFVSEFVANDIATVSGFMYGVDTEAHEKTVEFGGITVAVFGCGLNYVYPVENDELYGRILENGGCVISEYRPEAKPHLWKFPQRNRIVAGLANMGVLVVEAGLKSGSLITARLASEQSRKVYAIPGPVNSSVSAGTNWLIKEGMAEMVTDPKDILGSQLYAKASKGKPKIEGLSKLEEKIRKELEIEALSADEIAVQIGESVVNVMTTLTMMSIKGIISESGGKYYNIEM
jgi:DNA processing protein